MNSVKVMKDLVYQENIGNAGKLDVYLPEGGQVRAKKQFFLIMMSDNDISGRHEQNEFTLM